jgi:hypothetical protein
MTVRVWNVIKCIGHIHIFSRYSKMLVSCCWVENWKTHWVCDYSHLKKCELSVCMLSSIDVCEPELQQQQKGHNNKKSHWLFIFKIMHRLSSNIRSSNCILLVAQIGLRFIHFWPFHTHMNLPETQIMCVWPSGDTWNPTSLRNT